MRKRWKTRKCIFSSKNNIAPLWNTPYDVVYTWRSDRQGSWCTQSWLRSGLRRMDSWPQDHRRGNSRTGQKALALSTSWLLSSRAESVTRRYEISPCAHLHTGVHCCCGHAEARQSPISSVIYSRMQLKFTCILILTEHFPKHIPCARAFKYTIKIQCK
jgi:hypothetical protein